MAAYLSWTVTGHHIQGTLVTPSISGCQPVSTTFAGSISGDGVTLLAHDLGSLIGTIQGNRLVLNGLHDYPPIIFSPGNFGDYQANSQKYCGG